MLQLRLQVFDFLLNVQDFHEGDHNVAYILQQPEDVVNEVEVLEETLLVLPKADVLEVERVVSREVQDQSQVRQSFPKHHALRRLRVQIESVANGDDKGDFLTKTQDLAGVAHTRPESHQTSEEVVVRRAFSLEDGDDAHDEVLDNTAHLVSAQARVDDGLHLLKGGDHTS